MVSAVLFGILTVSSPSVSVRWRSPWAATVPSTSMPKPLNLTRSPTWNGWVEIDTKPARMLPTVCWAASPMITAVTEAPTATAPKSTPAIRRLTRTMVTRARKRTRKPTTPAEPGSSRRTSWGSRA